MNPRVGTDPLFIDLDIIDDDTGAPDARLVTADMIEVQVHQPNGDIVHTPTFSVVAPGRIRVEHPITLPGVHLVVARAVTTDPAQQVPTTEYYFTASPSSFVPAP